MTNNVYCTAPWNGITVRENGDVKTCCNGRTVLGNLNQDNIQNILESKNLREIQDSIINKDINSKNCQVCIQHEKQTGLSSLRQHYLKFYPDIYPKLKLKNLDIRWNNLCNLGCVYCSPTFSSVWEDRLSSRTNKPTKPYQTDLLEFILENIEQVDELMLVGGEPMLMKQNYELFNRLPESTNISIVTNFSYDLERLPCFNDLIKRPRQNIRWNLSLENFGDKFEYVRNGANWAEVEKNFEVLNKYWVDNISINLVYSMFTAFDLSESIQKFHQLGIKKFTLQTYYGPRALDVSSMPRPIRELALAQLDDTLMVHQNLIHVEDRDLYPLGNITNIQQHLSSTHSPELLTKTEFYRHIETQCDKWNTSKFKDLWPHIVTLVDRYLV